MYDFVYAISISCVFPGAWKWMMNEMIGVDADDCSLAVVYLVYECMMM